MRAVRINNAPTSGLRIATKPSWLPWVQNPEWNIENPKLYTMHTPRIVGATTLFYGIYGVDRGVCKIGSDTGRTVHFRAVGAQRGALKPDVRPWRRHMIGWPIWPAIDLARPCECHATTTHSRPERLRLALLCHLCRRTCDSPTSYWDF